jgi:hypothetical protein
MKLTTWTVLGSLLVTLLLGLVMTGVFCLVPARAGEPHGRGAAHATGQAHQAAMPVSSAPRRHHNYLVEARMGWSVG